MSTRVRSLDLLSCPSGTDDTHRPKSQGALPLPPSDDLEYWNAAQPEMTIALTDFSGFSGFRPLREIASYLATVPEFERVIGSSVAASFRKTISSASEHACAKLDQSLPASAQSDEIKGLQEALKKLFSALMNADVETVVKPNVRSLVKRYKENGNVKSSKQLPKGSVEELVVRLNEQFPDDIGIFCSFVLNVCTLKPGQALFLKANEPHAYLQGGMSVLSSWRVHQSRSHRHHRMHGDVGCASFLGLA